jgi:hypothetical protein
METEKSKAYQFIEMMWLYNGNQSCSRLNSTMSSTMSLAINGELQFNEDDFSLIYEKMRGGYWFGCNSNGKGYGDSFYTDAVMVNNMSAIKAYEKWTGLKPFISKDGHRVRTGSYFYNNEFRYHVTGFDFETMRIYLVAYVSTDWKEEGKRKLFNFDNKEWLVFRKTIIS